MNWGGHSFTRHPCGWPGCEERVYLHQWGCQRHYWRLPEELRIKLRDAVRGGKGRDGPRHLAVLEEIREWIRTNTFAPGAATPATPKGLPDDAAKG